ncbi:MAG: Translation initiation factor IF-2 [Candidatus Peregrinibacteria bacterium GW2011_GWA2_43_8]|nr:MAG: Translation initiation factor IF-2 [Candidatus Peregrinibacteria bacterium GW2011_GWA2_43_8]
MSVKVSELAKKLGMTEKELKVKSKALGCEIEEKEIEDAVADILEIELADTKKDAAEVYDEMIAKEMEREIIKSQRKKTAGKDTKGDSRKRISDFSVSPRSKIIEIEDAISVKEFAEKADLSAAKVIGELMKNGILANINQMLDFDTASIIADSLGLSLKRKRGAANVEDIMQGNLEKLLSEDDKSLLQKRPPVVSVMGHVDHGKTKLLDAIRNTNVVAGEAGGITQHIGAYQVVVPSEKKELKGKVITFLDTPGHEAFTSMRARGAKATDIAVLVVAADEGVKPQTIEAINHAKEAGIPIIVAINKIDKEAASPDRVKSELTEHGLQPEEWGGNTVMVPVSALTGAGVTTLLEMILLTTDMKDLKANPARPAVGTVIEADLDPNFGPVATILINTGTLKIMDNVIVGSTYGRIKAMIDHTGKRLKELKPSGVARIAGLSETPKSGDILQVVSGDKEARMQSTKIKEMRKSAEITGLGVGDIMARIQEGTLKTLKLIIKADTKGWIVVGFHVDAGPHTKALAEHENVEIVVYKIIYNLIDDMKKILTGMLEPEVLVVEYGKAEVKAIFFTGKNEMVVGVNVKNGKLVKDSTLRVFRGEQQVNTGKLIGLKIVNEDVGEVESGQECGIKFKGNFKLEVGDILEAFKEEKKIKTLS